MGRPKGSLNKVTRDIKELAGQHTPAALNTLVSVMTSGESESARVSAAKEILDRAYGNAPKAPSDNQHLHAHVFMAMPPVARDAQEWLENHRKSLDHG